MNNISSNMPVNVDGRNSRFRVFPNVLDIIVMAVWMFLSQVISLVAVGAFFVYLDSLKPERGEFYTVDPFEAEEEHALIIFAVYVLSMLLSLGGILLYRRLRGGRGRAVRFSLAGLNPTLLLWGIVWMLATVVVVEPLFEYLPDVPDNAGRGLWAVMSTVVCAPLFEEIICRGIILESVRSKYGVIMAWLVSTLFFAVIHGYITLIVNAFISGSILGYICIRSRSVLSSIFLHGVNNALAMTLIYLGMGDRTISSFISDSRIYAVVYIVSAAVCTIGLVSLVLGFIAEVRSEKAAKTDVPA